MKGHRIEKFEEVAKFCERMKQFDASSIECTAHTFFRLSIIDMKLNLINIVTFYILDTIQVPK